VVIVVIASHAVIDIMGYTGVIHVLAIIALTISASATVGISILIALKGCDTIVVEYSTGGRNTVDVASGFAIADILIGL